MYYKISLKDFHLLVPIPELIRHSCISIHDFYEHLPLPWLTERRQCIQMWPLNNLCCPTALMPWSPHPVSNPRARAASSQVPCHWVMVRWNLTRGGREWGKAEVECQQTCQAGQFRVREDQQVKEHLRKDRHNHQPRIWLNLRKSHCWKFFLCSSSSSGLHPQATSVFRIQSVWAKAGSSWSWLRSWFSHGVVSSSVQGIRWSVGLFRFHAAGVET